MGIRFEFFEAGCGDSILVSTDEGTNILIDGGFKYTFSDILEKYILLQSMGKKLDLVVLTHNDDDHILGLIELIKYEKEYLYRDKILEPTIMQVWFNSLDFDTPNVDDISKSYNSSKNSLISFSKLMRDKDNRIPFIEHVSVNKEEFQKSIVINDDIEILLLSPNNGKLDDLLAVKSKIKNRDYSNYLEEINNNTSNIKQYCSKDADDGLTNLSNKPFEPDGAEPNGVSIAFILIHENKKYLFLGDAHIPLIVDELKKYKKYFNNKGKIEFEFIKLSHHGSRKNINQDFLDLIETENFIILTNGSKYSHPDKETLSKIICDKTRNTKKSINFIFNYPKMLNHNKFKCIEMREKNFELIYSKKYPLESPLYKECP
jgi:beta-lactamase superfamily II metal-dependent hydrolase